MLNNQPLLKNTYEYSKWLVTEMCELTMVTKELYDLACDGAYYTLYKKAVQAIEGIRPMEFKDLKLYDLFVYKLSTYYVPIQGGSI